MQSETAPLHYVLYHHCAKWWFLALFVHNYNGSKSQKYGILKFYQPDIRAKTIMQVATISEPNLQEKSSSHALILSNAYNKNTDFDSINSEENLFGLTRPKLRAE